MKITKLEDHARSTNVRRIGVGEERLPERVLLAAYRTWHERDGTGTAADPVVCRVYSEVMVDELGVMAETRDTAKTNEGILLGGFFSHEMAAGRRPPQWLVACLSEQLNGLRVAVQYAYPERFADNLTARTVAALDPRVGELRRAARKVLQFIAGKSSSHKSKEKQSKGVLASLRVLGRLVSGNFDGPSGDAAFERIARNGDGVVLSYLFEGLDLPVHLRCDDDQFLFYLKILDKHLRNGSIGDLRSLLALGKDEFVACLNLIEELATNRIIRSQQRKRQARSDASGNRTKKSVGRPKKKGTSPQLLCAVIVEIARREWPEFVSSANHMCESLWRAAGGTPHTDSAPCKKDTHSTYETFDVWRLDWSPRATQAPRELRRNVEDSFSVARCGLRAQ
jgi:hypothetical protein